MKTTFVAFNDKHLGQKKMVTIKKIFLMSIILFGVLPIAFSCCGSALIGDHR